MPHQFPSILLVEDDAGDAFLAQSILRDMGLAQNSCVVNTGQDALDWLHRRGKFCDRPAGAPTVVVLDIKLPGISGLDVLAEMRADPDLKRVAAVIFSASNQVRDLQQAYELGANAYVVKSIEFETYKAKLSSLIEFWALTNEPPRDTAGSSD